MFEPSCSCQDSWIDTVTWRFNLESSWGRWSLFQWILTHVFRRKNRHINRPTLRFIDVFRIHWCQWNTESFQDLLCIYKYIYIYILFKAIHLSPPKKKKNNLNFRWFNDHISLFFAKPQCLVRIVFGFYLGTRSLRKKKVSAKTSTLESSTSESDRHPHFLIRVLMI